MTRVAKLKRELTRIQFEIVETLEAFVCGGGAASREKLDHLKEFRRELELQLEEQMIQEMDFRVVRTKRALR
jgi:hypothetical protein